MKKLVSLILGALFLSTSAALAQETPVPPEVERPELSEEVKSMVQDYRAENQALRAELRALIGELEDPAREDIQAVVEQFREENAERIAANRELGQLIREEVAEIRPDDRPDRPMAQLARQLRQETRQANRQLAQLRREFRQQVSGGDLSDDELAAAREEFQQERNAIRTELRDSRRQLIREAREEQSGANRTDG